MPLPDTPQQAATSSKGRAATTPARETGSAEAWAGGGGVAGKPAQQCRWARRTPPLPDHASPAARRLSLSRHTTQQPQPSPGLFLAESRARSLPQLTSPLPKTTDHYSNTAGWLPLQPPPGVAGPSPRSGRACGQATSMAPGAAGFCQLTDPSRLTVRHVRPPHNHAIARSRADSGECAGQGRQARGP